MELIGYFALIVLGFILSAIGGGGSLLSVPILVYLFSIDVVTASSYSLFIVGTSSLLGALQKVREDGADLRAAFVFGCSSAVALLQHGVDGTFHTMRSACSGCLSQSAGDSYAFFFDRNCFLSLILLKRTSHATGGEKRRLQTFSLTATGC